jgi:hypothetical protein
MLKLVCYLDHLITHINACDQLLCVMCHFTTTTDLDQITLSSRVTKAMPNHDIVGLVAIAHRQIENG